ncbi:hypothetical protein [Mesorhizobium sp.]|uniref:hypothetical protein n=1 Tax=Mesorhizobium sp. TaxID=1871066 RepID=UPI0025C29FEF|nr:hypothetical protein [Mesorhizobium sp.]
MVGGTDLVLYADNPTFLELAQDPNSGTTDPGVFQMAQYLDDVEASSSPDNPMALLINMLRFLPDEMELGSALTRLTPHYAVHTFEMINRSCWRRRANAPAFPPTRIPTDAVSGRRSVRKPSTAATLGPAPPAETTS